MAIRIDETFEVHASADSVWAFLLDPAQVVKCLPGAELLASEDERTFTGRIRVKVGPVVAAYRGRARFDEIDVAAHRVRMSGEGQETSGAGAAKMSMTSVVTALPGGGASVHVESEVDVVGKLVQFGRGMIEEVSRQLFRQFADCARSRIESSASAVPPLSGDEGIMPRESAGSSAPLQPDNAGSTPAAAAPVAMPAAAPPAQDPGATPLRLLPLIWSAIRKRVGRLLRRAP